MGSNDLLLIAAIGAFIWIFVLYIIIKSAVKSALSESHETNRRQTRLLMLQMKQQGISDKNIEDAFLKNDSKFWNELKSSGS